MLRSQNGFTLIELMIVVIVIGIIAAIAIPNFLTMQNFAREGSTKAKDPEERSRVCTRDAVWWATMFR